MTTSKSTSSKKVRFEEPKSVNPFIHLRSLQGLGKLKKNNNITSNSSIPFFNSKSQQTTDKILRRIRNNTFINSDFEQLLASNTRIRALSNKNPPKYEVSVNNPQKDRKTIDYNSNKKMVLTNQPSLSRTDSQTSVITAHLRNDSSFGSRQTSSILWEDDDDRSINVEPIKEDSIGGIQIVNKDMIDDLNMQLENSNVKEEPFNQLSTKYVKTDVV